MDMKMLILIVDSDDTCIQKHWLVSTDHQQVARQSAHVFHKMIGTRPLGNPAAGSKLLRCAYGPGWPWEFQCSRPVAWWGCCLWLTRKRGCLVMALQECRTWGSHMSRHVILGKGFQTNIENEMIKGVFNLARNPRKLRRFLTHMAIWVVPPTISFQHQLNGI